MVSDDHDDLIIAIWPNQEVLNNKPHGLENRPRVPNHQTHVKDQLPLVIEDSLDAKHSTIYC